MNDHVAVPMGGDLEHLLQVANVHLPAVAGEFVNLNETMSGAQLQTPSPSVNRRLNDIRDEIQYASALAATHLVASQTGIHLAIEGYVDQDQGTADSLESVMEDENALPPEAREAPELDQPEFPESIPQEE